MRNIRVRLAKNSYNILIGRMGFSRLVECVKRLNIGRDVIIITNRTIYRLYGSRLKKGFCKKGFTIRVEFVEDKETAKAWPVAARLLERIARFDRLKKIFLVAFGGGVVGDLAGFVASIYKRGIPYIQVPTTLLSQVDSAIGGKVAIDLLVAKNLVGSFYQPRLVFSELSILDTLPHREMASGLSEVIKYGMIKNRALFEFVENSFEKILEKDPEALEHIAYVSSAIKARIVEQDEFDNKDKRIILNFGHTIGHAIEAATNYSGRYTHGEAIGIGMLCACIISERLGLLNPVIRKRLESLFQRAGLPIKLKGIQLSDIFAAYEHDKKFISGCNRFILPITIGKAIIKEDIPKSIINKALEHIIEG